MNIAEFLLAQKLFEISYSHRPIRLQHQSNKGGLKLFGQDLLNKNQLPVVFTKQISKQWF
jgi:hypothetical protein